MKALHTNLIPRVFAAHRSEVLSYLYPELGTPAPPAATEENISDWVAQRLAAAGSLLDVLQEIGEAVAPELRHRYSEEACRRFWGEHDGILLPPGLQARLQAAVELVREEFALLRTEIDAPETWSGALEAHANVRYRIFGYRVLGWIDDDSLSDLQIIADWILLQRAVRDDLRRTAFAAACFEHLAGAVTREDARDLALGGGRALLSRAVLAHLADPLRISSPARLGSCMAGDVSLEEMSRWCEAHPA